MANRSIRGAQTVVFVNLPQDDKFVNASQFLYSIAILLSTPLQLFPAVRIMENGIFAAQKSGKRSLKVKWEKNAFRTVVVVVCALIAWFGAADLDKFVSLIGSLAWCVFRQFLERKRTSAISLTTLCSLLGPGVAQRPARVDLPGAPALEGVRPQPETKSRRYRTHRVWGRRDYLYHQADGAFCHFPLQEIGGCAALLLSL